MRLLTILTIFALIQTLHHANAADPSEQFSLAGDRFAKFCAPTPQLQSYNHPGKKYVPLSNKLTRPAGKALFSDGQRLYLTGRIFDSACVPLREAKVEIWHADVEGDYRIVDASDLHNPYAVFAGAGQIRTDNNGEYAFETIMPGIKNIKNPPLINIRVSHPAMKAPLTSTIFFPDDIRNQHDKRYRSMSNAKRALVTAKMLPLNNDNDNYGFRAHHDVTVNARDGFRGF